MVLFPIAFIWVAIVMIWVIRQSIGEPGVDESNDTPRRWPRRPRSPQSGPVAGGRGNARENRPQRAAERSAPEAREL